MLFGATIINNINLHFNIGLGEGTKKNLVVFHMITFHNDLYRINQTGMYAMKVE